jgi:type II secretory pathway component GspD/PulD (secretin)
MTSYMLGLALFASSLLPTPKASEPVYPKPKPQAPAAVRVVEDIRCSVQVVQEDPAKVLQVISKQTKTNLILLTVPEVKLTINLTDVRLVDMIRHICALTQLSYLKVGDTFVLAQEDKLKAAYGVEWNQAHPPAEVIPAAPIVTKVYRAGYVSSVQLAAALEKLFDKTKLTAVAGPVQTNPSLTSRDAGATTGVSGTAIAGGSGDESANKLLVLRGDAETVEAAYRLAEQMDTARPQVAIEVTIHDISNNALKELGLQWTIGNVSITEKATGDLNIGSFSRAPQSFSAVVKALEKNEKAKLLASPNISVLDGEKAFILIGDRLNFPVLVGYTQNNTPIFNREVERVGIYLQVAASVSSDQNITLTLYPQVSSITGFLEVNGASYPQVSTREAQTTLRMKSGETVVLGGLLKSEDIVSIDRLPILSDLPFIGELFKHRKKTKNTSQVIISIKPTLIAVDEHR